jgi:predicted  nucleic acid-binding Zn ribbon protein
MNRPARRLDVVAMTSATYQASDYASDLIARATRLQDDPEREKRVAAGLCRWCYYAAGRLGGASMTTQPCASCGEDQMYGSTATDALCLPCAKEHSLCKRCGGDRETRTLRRKWPKLPKESP